MIEALQAALDRWHADARFPGATLGVALETGKPFGLAVGLADRERKTPMTPAARMLQGSVGKTYVAAVALQLVQAGKLALDEKVSTYLGDAPWFARLPNARQITVRQLMNHTSGLVRYEFQEAFTRDLTASPERVWKPEELLGYILDTTAPFAAGQSWEYSDTNYIVLGVIIERLTRARYYDEARRRLLKPHGLRDTIPSDARRLPGVVQGYAGPGNPFGGSDAMQKDGVFTINPQFEWCGGGMASTATDLARWGKLLYEARVFAPALRDAMVAGVPARLGRDVTYGLGAMVRPTPLGPAWGHSGFFPGYLTEMLYFPERRLCLAIQVNTSVGRALGKPLVRQLIELAEIAATAKGTRPSSGCSAPPSSAGTPARRR